MGYYFWVPLEPWSKLHLTLRSKKSWTRSAGERSLHTFHCTSAPSHLRLSYSVESYQISRSKDGFDDTPFPLQIHSRIKKIFIAVNISSVCYSLWLSSPPTLCKFNFAFKVVKLTSCPSLVCIDKTDPEFKLVVK